MIKVLAAALSLACLSVPAFGQDTANIPEARSYETRGQVTVNGQRVRYTATAGETYLLDDDGNPTASIFSTAYIADGTTDPRTRPVAFVFNGGPGSASLWLHMGVFGPQRLVLPDVQDDGAAPYDVVENVYSILDVADLVFVDPVGTGWSRPLGDHEGSEFWGVDEDAESLAAFMRMWLSEHQRWNSPKFLLGESYGTLRIGALLNQLEGGFTDVSINGVALISTVLDFRFDDTSDGNDVGYVGLMPGFAATAWYHGRVDRSAWNNDINDFLDAARTFAIEEYMPALMHGVTLPAERKARIVSELSQFTGLSESFLERANLRVSLRRFQRELLRDQGLSVGRLDSRYTGQEVDGVGDSPEQDPSFYGIDGSYTASMLDYFTRTLGVDITEYYSSIGGVRGWNWDVGQSGGNSYINVAPWIARAMRQNSDLQVLVAQGHYDLATPFFAAELMFNQPGFDQDRVHFKYYEAGHMMYIHQPSLVDFSSDIRELITNR
ncbi:S10 family peptidase [Maricaulis salignorans]|uniref:Carboxypeptidase C (Cathepsin A) n=1 Tax=Maricaulis salignorans TaxID=144026 RepID=A0A1G9MVA7_9PROT|nr:peptidase S10 [Maricaulis salignorans]SDL77575.1 Carboxypeptidase C (cathepsin A) [Maricaulis salignorans]